MYTYLVHTTTELCGATPLHVQMYYNTWDSGLYVECVQYIQQVHMCAGASYASISIYNSKG